MSDHDALRARLERWRLSLELDDAPRTGKELAELLTCVTESLARLEQQNRRLQAHEQDFDSRLLAMENSRFFRTLRFPGRLWLAWKGRLGQALLRSPAHPLYLKLVGQTNAVKEYQEWLAHPPATLAPILTPQPLLSILTAVHNTRLEWLREAADSVTAQSYDNWQWCLCDDACPDKSALEFVTGLAAKDSRILVTKLDRHGGISAAFNQAAAMARGEYICFLDHDDTLAPEALLAVASAVEDGWPDLVYTDEDHLEGGRRVQPVFKPGYSPDLLDSCMYMGHLLVVRRSRFEELGGLRSAFDGSQDYDLALRIAEISGRVRHIPRILYHWRRHAGSTSIGGKAKPYAQDAGLRALRESVSRRRAAVAVANGAEPHSYRIHWPVPADVTASLILCTRNPELLRNCLDAIEKNTAHRPLEVIVVRHETGPGQHWDAGQLAMRPVWVPYRGRFNFSLMNNLGARHAGGAVLVFLNDDVAPLQPDWLAMLMGNVLRPEVGIAGARLLYPSGAIQHAGMTLGLLHGVGHLHRNTFASKYWKWLPFPRNVSAVTGACLAIRREVFQELGGFDEEFPVNYNDVDLCLRARRAGYQVIVESGAVLQHSECSSRTPGISIQERDRFEVRWADLLSVPDPYYNPNLSPYSEDPVLLPEGPPGELPNR